MKSTEQYFPVVLFIVLYKLALSGRILNHHLLIKRPFQLLLPWLFKRFWEIKDAWLIPLLFRINAPLIHSVLINKGANFYCKKKTANMTKLNRRDEKWADFVSGPAAAAVDIVFFF